MIVAYPKGKLEFKLFLNPQKYNTCTGKLSVRNLEPHSLPPAPPWVITKTVCWICFWVSEERKLSRARIHNLRMKIHGLELVLVVPL